MEGILALRYLNLAGVHRLMSPNRASWADPIPNWVNLGSREKVEWLNKILTSVWPLVAATISDIIEGLVEPLLQETLKKSGVRGITLGFEEFNLGDTAPRVEAIQVDDADPDNISLTCNVKWKADPDIVFAVSGPAIYGGLSALTVEIRDLVVSGNLQVDISLMPAPPLVAGVRVMFTENPYLSYDVGRRGQILTTPGPFYEYSIVFFSYPIINNITSYVICTPHDIIVSLLSLITLLPYM